MFLSGPKSKKTGYLGTGCACGELNFKALTAKTNGSNQISSPNAWHRCQVVGRRLLSCATRWRHGDVCRKSGGLGKDPPEANAGHGAAGPEISRDRMFELAV
jgi:hypothetical protein